MNYSILSLCSLIGSIALFIYGIKLLGQSFQKLSGEKVRKIFNKLSSNRLSNMMTGCIVSSGVQTSSAFSVMLVSFVNAGIISLIQAISVIMGANIGNTIKIWIITLIGFNTEFGIVAMVLIALTFPLIFSRKIKRQTWGELILGVSLLFLGLNLIQMFIPTINENPVIYQYISSLSTHGFTSVLLFFFIGILITTLIRSSSAVVVFIVVLAYYNWISFPVAAAMILGANLGTTITPNLAVRDANVHAKRVAFSNTIINIIGVVWALLIFRWSLSGIDQLTINIWGSSPNIDLLAIPFALALYHSAYNLVNTFLLLGFSSFIAVLSEKIFIPKSASDEEFQLKFISTGFSLSEFSLLEVQKELPNFVKFCKKMFDLVPLLLLEKNKDNYDSLLNLIKTYEDKSDDIDKEIADYLKKVSLGELSEKGAKKLNSMLRISKEIESISDCSYHMANRINMKNDQNAWFAQELRNNLKKMFDMLNVTFDQTLENLQGDYDHVSIEKAQLHELQINKLRNELLNDHLTKVNDNEYSYQSSLAYFDLVSTCEKIGDHLFNINEAIVGLK